MADIILVQQSLALFFFHTANNEQSSPSTDWDFTDGGQLREETSSWS